MIKEILYTYLGTNGTITSKIHLKDIYYIQKYRLWADDGKVLVKNGKIYGMTQIIPEDELNEWSEIDRPE